MPLPDDENATAHVSGGLVMLQDDRSYLRIERASFTRAGTVNHYANFEQRIDGKRTRMGRFADFPLQNDKPVDLRVEVKAGTVRALARHEIPNVLAQYKKYHDQGFEVVGICLDTDREKAGKYVADANGVVHGFFGFFGFAIGSTAQH